MALREELLEALDYDPITGWFTNRVSRGRALKGARAGSLTGHGYRRIVFSYLKFYEHHLAWYFVHGYLPEEIDHKDGVRSNNAIENLRECSRTENNFNSERDVGSSGLRGAYLDPRSLKWFSKIQVGCQVIWLGNFDSADEAHEAFMNAVDTYHGEFALHNRNQPMEAM